MNMKYQINAEIIADSKNEFGQRITTFVLNYPRIIHAEMMTHRVFSRNAASSRAIPVEKMISQIEDNPFVPLTFQKNHSGMQGTEYLTGKDYETARDLWLMSRDSAVISAKEMVDRGITKQLINRTLEPYQWYQAIFTATEWENFFYLRCPQYYISGNTYKSKKDAIEENPEAKDFSKTTWLKLNEGQGEIHIMALAEAMWDAMNESEPKQLKAGEWHIPFGDKFDAHKLDKILWSDYDVGSYCGTVANTLQVKISTARCARVSYLNFEGKDDYKADVELHDRLSSMGHWSPFEHCARVMNEREYQQHVRTSKANTISTEAPEDKDSGIVESTVSYLDKEDLGWSGNFKGFLQYREMVE